MEPTMRRYLLLVPFVFACAKGEEAPADSAAMAPAPAVLTEADVAGTWTGTAMTPTDSVFAHFSVTCGAGICRLTNAESPKDTVQSSYVLAGDSLSGTSTPHAEASMKGVMVVDHYVARLTGGQVNGTGHVTLADKPDSVVMRSKFTGTKTP
jgi:hypothetical protein